MIIAGWRFAGTRAWVGVPKARKADRRARFLCTLLRVGAYRCRASVRELRALGLT